MQRRYGEFSYRRTLPKVHTESQWLPSYVYIRKKLPDAQMSSHRVVENYDFGTTTTYRK